MLLGYSKCVKPMFSFGLLLIFFSFKPANETAHKLEPARKFEGRPTNAGTGQHQAFVFVYRIK